MSEPICKLFLVRFLEPWYQLSKDEQAGLLAQLNAAFERVGGKRIVFCDAGWATEQWSEFGVEEFPDLAAVQQFRQALDAINWFRYVETMTFLGTKLEHA
jgi:hypothetical protein